eukprot:Skav207427  [mRNA]  locus=scaffold646:295550:303151:- [translate_table: standard]
MGHQRQRYTNGPTGPAAAQTRLGALPAMESVILVPGVRRMDLADFDGVMIQAEDCDTWRKMNGTEQSALRIFLEREKRCHENLGEKERSNEKERDRRQAEDRRRKRGYIKVGSARVGFCENGTYLRLVREGTYFLKSVNQIFRWCRDVNQKLSSGESHGHRPVVFAVVFSPDLFSLQLHENHLKRYFGLKRSYANVMLLNLVPEAVRKVETPLEGGGLLAALASHMPTIGQDKLWRLWRLRSADECREMMERADADENDGELHEMMTSCGMRPSEVKTLVEVLDTDDDGDMASQL